MDAITFLKNDHKTVEQLFKRFEHAGDRAYVEKRQIVDRIIEELSQHAAVEELVFYPVTRATVDGVEHMALESLEEHHIVKWLLEELSDLDPSHERFDAKVTVLMENVRHHVKEEEGDYFPKVRHELGRTALGDLGEAMADAKETAPTHPHPRGADTPPGNVVTGAVTGVVDRVGDTVSGIAQGSVTVLQELIARITHTKRPVASPTGSSVARKTARQARAGAETAAAGKRTVESATAGAKKTVRAAKAGAKGTATTARKSAGATATTAKRAATTTRHTAEAGAKSTSNTAKRATSRTKRAATTGADPADPSGCVGTTNQRGTLRYN